jgi:hypothetical protein
MILSHITNICLVYTAEVGTNLCDVADHYAQNGTHTYLLCFSVTPPKKLDRKLAQQKKKCNTPKQEPQSAPVSKNAAVSSSHQNVYQHKVK